MEGGRGEGGGGGGESLSPPPATNAKALQGTHT